MSSIAYSPRVFKPTARDIEQVENSGREEFRSWLRRQSPERIKRWLDAKEKTEIMVETAAFVAERAKGTNAASTSQSITVSGITVGNHLVLWLIVGSGGISHVTGITDGGNTYTVDVTSNSSGTNSGSAICSGYISGSAPTTLTVSLSAIATLTYKVEEISGLATSAWFDVGNSAAAATSTAQSTPSVTPAAAGEFAFAGFNANTAESSFTKGGSYVLAGTTRNANPDVAVEYLLSCPSGSQNATGTWAAAANATGVNAIAFYKLAPPPAAIPPSDRRRRIMSR